MKIARFSHDGSIAFGIVDDDELVVLTGDPMFAGYDTTGDRVELVDVKLLAPVIPRSKVIVLREGTGLEGARPSFILKPNTAVVGPGDPIVIPAQSSDVTVTGALGIIIGTFAKNVSIADAAGVIFGYTVAADVTARDLELQPDQAATASAFDSFSPLGPIIDTEYDPSTAVIHGRINDGQFQNSSAAVMEHSVAEIVSFASSIFTLLPGDVILTGVPGSSGTIEAGDAVQIEIPGIGVLVNSVRAA
ncbi:fumarylacetoacetate hydrolase family protein [Cryobacterium sp. CG_9.6]|uniref:fumarylacetoacetate hydrolase family protein n=1 Tax=Cryobacterium sp. CG_9.6 TaxID=2760710 RepID=UPI002476B7B0|nr:fumarylacetoacetate hydrolase family protein [Cryobacterium sp. CG_9.6]MDH6236399.1 2-keto-4-pentenoate hydratase/2-oxohepta-3-ene-1,7-dioic acid hydratase in catechol pathway [Cryobacterium sp. CG_9.6]